MKKRIELIIILCISIAGILFSGYLSYTEIFAGFCGASKLRMGNCTNVFQIPACVYGFVIYLVILIISILGLRSRK
jgi:uncharacterized membrane protein